MAQRKSDEKTLAALRRKDERLRLALDGGRMGMCEFDESAGVARIDDSDASLLGFPAGTSEIGIEELLSRIHSDDRTTVMQSVAAAKGTGKDYTAEFRILLPDGKLRWLGSRGRWLRDPGVNAMRMVAVCYDVSERRQAQDAMRTWQQTFERSEFAIALGDKEGETLIAVNQAFARMHGWSVAELTGAPVLKVFPVEVQSQVAHYVHAANTSAHYNWESKHIRKDGTIFPVQIHSTPIRDDAGNVSFRAAFVEDITERKRVLQALSEREQRFHAIFDGTFEFLGLLEPGGTLLEVNKTALDYIGAPAAEVIGQPFWETPWWRGAPEQQEQLRKAIAEAAQGKFVRFEAQHPAKDGSIHTIDVSIRPILDENGRVSLLIPEGRRITERKRAELALRDSQQRLQHALAVGGMGTWERDLRSDEIKWDERTYQIFGVELGTRVDMGFFHAHIHGEDLPGLKSVIEKTIATGSEYRCDFRFLRPNGDTVWIQGRGGLRHDEAGLPTHIGGINFDISDRKRAEVALQQADRRKDEFLAVLSHELRNPLAPIRNVINLLERKNSLDPDVRWARDIISHQTDHFTRLIDDLLDVSRITRDKLVLQRERVELGDIFDAAVEISRPVIERYGHQLAITLPPGKIYLDADLTRLSQVLMNLLNNAAKYTPHGGRINLSAEREGASVVVRVADNGSGIAADHLAKLFDMFYQADRSYEQSQGGLGIGLTLVKRLVEMHGGTVQAHSAGLNQGSEFSVRLPVTADQPSRPVETAGEEKALTSACRILVVDDYGNSAETLAKLLTYDGNEVQIAHDGLEALVVAEQFHPGIALLDLGMPKLNGYETARKMREQPWAQDLVLIAVTGWGHEDSRRRSKEAGFVAHLIKPIVYPELLKLLAHFADHPENRPTSFTEN